MKFRLKFKLSIGYWWMLMLMLVWSSPLTLHAAWPESNKTIKFIDLSWSNPTVDFYVKNLKMLEQCTPLDGLVIRFRGTPRQVNGKNFYPGSNNPMGKIPWKYEDFKEQIAQLKMVKSTKFTDNFFYTVVSPGTAEWFSDADWKIVVNNYAIAARVAKETGLKGILFDIEEYGKKFWKVSTIKTGENLHAARCIARQRGREWGRAVFAVYPEIKIFALFGFSLARPYNLIGPFFNGILDVMPPQAILIEGHESASYRAHSPADYTKIENDVYRRFLLRVAPENRLKYLQQVSLAPGFYLDALFRHDENSRYWKSLQVPVGADRVAVLRRNLIAATAVSDEYIWLYGEKGCWWPHRRSTWESTHPGITRMVSDIKKPSNIDIAPLTNLLTVACGTNKNAKWKFWQIEDDLKKPGKKPGCGWEKDGELFIQAVNSGCWSQGLAVQPGEVYLLRGWIRHQHGDSGIGTLAVAFRDKHKRWLPPNTKREWRLETDFNRAWHRVDMLIVIPPQAAFASVQVGGNSMNINDIYAFKELSFCRLDLVVDSVRK